ncbi:MAG TPA: hypothetical protein VEQ58_07190, partial [Polyangiaceae bacterium]|nr:hypothetical protein [Polyangiaceae bacterium]
MRAFPGCLALLLLLPACGGSPTEPPPQSAADSASSSSSASRRKPSAAASDNEADAPAERESAKGPSCDDGTCSVCGNGICPTGWYCDEKTSACSWLAECAEKPTCACVKRVLGPA